VTPEDLRSRRWFGAARTDGVRQFSHRSRARQLGITEDEIDGKPLIAILNTWSGINPCHMHLRERAESVKRGVLEKGGFPVEMPVATLSETFQKPTPMMYRNLLAMEAEELLRSYPFDGAVLMGGCDKTTPALIMGAASADIPAIFVPAGPMLTGRYKGGPAGSGTDMWRVWDDFKAGTGGRSGPVGRGSTVTDCDLQELEEGIARSPGHCMTMGTASTMTSAAEVLGMTLPGAASIPAVDSAHYRMAVKAGQTIVDWVWNDTKPSTILTREAFEDAAATVLALGGSTNSLIHLIAMAGRANVKLTLDDFDAISRRVPWLANVRPSGEYLMEDFYYAGGLPALLGQLSKVPGALHGPHPERQVHNPDVIRSPETALAPEGGVAVLRGNLAPDGAVIKHIAADQHLLRHTGPAVVFEDYKDLKKRINDPALAITKDSVLVLRNAGPRAAGMPEYGQLPIPDYLLAQGVRDMVRISDARMSGTSYGACVLHVAPEAAVGGPLALIQSGDPVTLDVPARLLQVDIPERIIASRRARWHPPEPRYGRGYGALYSENVTQANEGCDFEFLARRGATPEPDPS
jgi:dihydroxy-acid dehydratase